MTALRFGTWPGAVALHARFAGFLALAAAYDGVSRTEAAKVGGMDRQTLRDWAHRFNDEGPDGLKHRSGAGRPPALDARTDERTLCARGNRPRSRGGRRGSLATYRPEAGHRRTLWCDLQRADPLRSAGGAVLLAHQRASAAPQTGGAVVSEQQVNAPLQSGTDGDLAPAVAAVMIRPVFRRHRRKQHPRPPGRIRLRKQRCHHPATDGRAPRRAPGRLPAAQAAPAGGPRTRRPSRRPGPAPA